MHLYQYLLEHHSLSKKRMHQLLKMKAIKINDAVVFDEKKEIDGLFHTISIQGQNYPLEAHKYYVLNKPAGYVTAVSDHKFPTVCDLFSEKLWPIGRLDRSTEGLLILTDHGLLTFRLPSPRYGIEKVYRVKVNGKLDRQIIEQFACGIEFIGGILCAPAKLEIIAVQDDESEALVTLTEGKYHQVKKMFLAVGLYVTYLQRIQYGPIMLDHDLQIGQSRALTVNEVQLLWDCVQLDY